MKRWILAGTGIAALVGIGFLAGRSPSISPSVGSTPVEQFSGGSASDPNSPGIQRTGRDFVEIESRNAAVRTSERSRTTEPDKQNQIESNVSLAATNAAGVSAGKLILDQSMATLLSTATSFKQKQDVWKRLRDAGKLDVAISDLEQRVAANPQSAESVSTLGQAYYKKAGDTKDVRESAILAMKADQTLEAALNLDPSNWDTRYVRAVGMTYWPPELNKTKDVIEQFNILMQQQESQPPQSKFAKTYLKLGEEYEKAGYPQYAADVWKRGAALFPSNDDLKEKLSGVH